MGGRQCTKAGPDLQCDSIHNSLSIYTMSGPICNSAVRASATLEKHYQKGIYASVAKQAQSMMAQRAKFKKVIKIVG